MVVKKPSFMNPRSRWLFWLGVNTNAYSGRFHSTPTEIIWSSVKIFFQRWSESSILESDSNWKTLISDWSTNWASKNKLHRRLQRFRPTEIGQKNFPTMIKAFYHWIRYSSDLNIPKVVKEIKGSHKWHWIVFIKEDDCWYLG